MKLQFRRVKELSGRTKLWYRSRRVYSHVGFVCRRPYRTCEWLERICENRYSTTTTSSSSSSRDHTGAIDPQWRNVDCCIYSEFQVSSWKVDVQCGEVGCRQEVNSRVGVRRRRNLFDLIVSSEIEEPGAEPGRMTEGFALLECHSQRGRARSSTPVHDQPGSCLWWSWACIEYETVNWEPTNYSWDRIVFANSEHQTCIRI